MEAQIKVDNLKCGGCASTITKQIKAMEGITEVNVLPDEGEVDITYTEQADLNKVKQKLHDLGYPESGTAEGFDKISSNIKSYMSCAVGRLTKEDEKEQDDKSHPHK